MVGQYPRYTTSQVYVVLGADTVPIWTCSRVRLEWRCSSQESTTRVPSCTPSSAPLIACLKHPTDVQLVSAASTRTRPER